MKCPMCGGSATEVAQSKNAKYRDEVVQVKTKMFQCDSCHEGFVTPQQMRDHVRVVKDEVRRKHGLLLPRRIAGIRKKLGLTQEQLEDLLGTGQKVVVRWENGKVIQGSGHDITLRLLERDSKALKDLRLIRQERATEQKTYEKAHKAATSLAAATAPGSRSIRNIANPGSAALRLRKSI
jgi:putative zinc finger/helix-turn-helix YgiT family protein